MNSLWKHTVSRDETGKICKVIFESDLGGYQGILHFSHEVTLGYDIRTNEWHGDMIDVSGWNTMHNDEIKKLVIQYNLADEVKEVLKNE